jgi:hypothetical protein
MAVIDKSVPRSFGEILGGLMGAVIDAQAQAARATIDFIEEVGTTSGSLEGNDVHELRNISFNYTKKDENDNLNQFKLELPLLSIVEIPAINIKTAKFSFYYDVVDTVNTDTVEKSNEPTSSSTGGANAVNKAFFARNKPVRVVGRVSKETNTSSNIEKNAGIKVDIEFQQAALTVGLERILDMLELSATETKNG